MQKINQSGTDVKTVQDMPTVPIYAEWLWLAYARLARRRGASSAGPQPIAMTEVEAYARYHGMVSRFEREALMEVITALDDVYLEHQRKEAKKAREKGKGKTGAFGKKRR